MRNEVAGNVRMIFLAFHHVGASENPEIKAGVCDLRSTSFL